jgi:hypothetical protein
MTWNLLAWPPFFRSKNKLNWQPELEMNSMQLLELQRNRLHNLQQQANEPLSYRLTVSNINIPQVNKSNFNLEIWFFLILYLHRKFWYIVVNALLHHWDLSLIILLLTSLFFLYHASILKINNQIGKSNSLSPMSYWPQFSKSALLQINVSSPLLWFLKGMLCQTSKILL